MLIGRATFALSFKRKVKRRKMERRGFIRIFNEWSLLLLFPYRKGTGDIARYPFPTTSKDKSRLLPNDKLWSVKTFCHRSPLLDKPLTVDK
jgi:hypothetical protein